MSGSSSTTRIRWVPLPMGPSEQSSGWLSGIPPRRSAWAWSAALRSPRTLGLSLALVAALGGLSLAQREAALDHLVDVRAQQVEGWVDDDGAVERARRLLARAPERPTRR